MDYPPIFLHIGGDTFTIYTTHMTRFGKWYPKAMRHVVNGMGDVAIKPFEGYDTPAEAISAALTFLVQTRPVEDLASPHDLEDATLTPTGHTG